MHNYSDSERSLLERYLEELYRFNARINLTAVPEPQAWSKHIDESVALLEVFDFPSQGTLIDLGSGAGLPGIPIAVVRPHLKVTLVESDQRKAGFLDHVLAQLTVRAEVLCSRAEELGRGELRESFDVAITRAAFPPPVLPEFALPLVSVGGAVVAMETDPKAAALAMADSIAACGGQLEKAIGSVVVIRKVSATPESYPRRRPK